MDLAATDALLTTTRSVRKRLDLGRPVEPELLEECLEIALQAPTGSNSQGWQFVFVTEQAKKDRIAELYAQVWETYKTMPVAIHNLHRDSADSSLVASQERSTSSAEYLAANLANVPVMLIPCVAGRVDAPEVAERGNFAMAATYGSISAVTFVTCTRYLDSNGVAWSGHLVAAMALMESPAIIIGLLLFRVFGQEQKKNQHHQHQAAGAVLQHQLDTLLDEQPCLVVDDGLNTRRPAAAVVLEPALEDLR